MNRKLIGVLIGGISAAGAGCLIYVLIQKFFGTAFAGFTFELWLSVFCLAMLQIISSLFWLAGRNEAIVPLMVCFVVQLLAFSFGDFAFIVTTGPVLLFKYDANLNTVDLDFSLFQVYYKFSLTGGYKFITINFYSAFVLIALNKFRTRQWIAKH